MSYWNDDRRDQFDTQTLRDEVKYIVYSFDGRWTGSKIWLGNFKDQGQAERYAEKLRLNNYIIRKRHLIETDRECKQVSGSKYSKGSIIKIGDLTILGTKRTMKK